MVTIDTMATGVVIPSAAKQPRDRVTRPLSCFVASLLAITGVGSSPFSAQKIDDAGEIVAGVSGRVEQRVELRGLGAQRRCRARG